MPKEEPQGMNRRDFLKTLPTGAGVVALEKGAQVQERPPLDNSIEELTLDNEYVKINYSGKPKEITPEVEDVILSLENYQLTYHKTVLEKEVIQARQRVWQKLKKLNPSLPEFSNDNFYKTLITKVPHYLAEYGIFSQPLFKYMRLNKSSRSGTFLFTELSMNFLEVDHIEHDEVEQWGTKISRDIVYLKGPVKVKDRTITTEKNIPHAQNAFGNIFMHEQGIREEFNILHSAMQSLQNETRMYPNGEGIKILQKQLEQSKQFDDAVKLAMARVIERIDKNPSFDEFKAEILAHETRHMFDILQGTYTKENTFKKTDNPTKYDKQNVNRSIHYEINALLAQLRYGPNKEFSLLRLLADSRDGSENSESFKKYHQWTLGHIVGLVSEDPERYGLKVSAESSVNTYNQILSQIDALLDHPNLIDLLCERVIDLHNKNLAEDIIGETPIQIQGPIVEQKQTDFTSAYKIGIPVAIIGTGIAAYGLKKFIERKKKVAKASLTKEQKRQKKRKEKKKKK